MEWSAIGPMLYIGAGVVVQGGRLVTYELLWLRTLLVIDCSRVRH